MPELPDVEVFKRYFDATALHKKITDVQIMGREILSEGVDVDDIRQEFKGQTFEQTRRHGKHLFVQLDNGRWLRMHFGMSGALKYFKAMDAEPEYEQILITFANGYHLAYIAPRKLGTVDVVEDVEAFIAERELGPDVADANFDFAAFQACLADRGGMIKSALVDQQVMAGIGNVYADEILFQACIHPRTPISALNEQDLRRLFRTMKDVLVTAIERQGNPDELPREYLTPHRNQDGTCPHCGESLERIQVSGRSTYYCPNRQGADIV